MIVDANYKPTFGYLCKEIHKNAVEHGWWDEQRDTGELFALMHSELSEALEEARAGRPMVWEGEGSKPEGIAVELIDMVIRFMDFVGLFLKSTKDGKDLHFDDLMADCPAEFFKDMHISALINFLHCRLCTCYEENVSPYFEAEDKQVSQALLASIHARCMSLTGIIFCWCRENGVEDPLALLLRKHAYNKTRPYKHGKIF